VETIVDRLRVELEIDEGCKYHIYLDHLGLPTAGIGHLIKESDPEHGKPVGTVISKERVDEWFEQDIMTTIHDCKKVFDDWNAMNEEVKLIMANMMFNLGYPRFCKFRLMIQAVRDGDHIEAANQMKQSRWYKQVTNRAERLISRMKGVDLHK
jgi:lysozyme